jgi:hypothetical protein
LTVAYGDAEKAKTFLKLLRDTTREIPRLETSRDEARGIGAASLDLRQQRRWQNLADELDRRIQILKKSAVIKKK